MKARFPSLIVLSLAVVVVSPSQETTSSGAERKPGAVNQAEKLHYREDVSLTC
jgi:hypothetical protein